VPLKGRLGLESADIPHADRHGLMWLSRGKVKVEDGTVVFATAGTDRLDAGSYDIPFQTISNLLLGPGTTISHDALRLLARHDTGLLAIGSNGVRLYACSVPFGPDRAKLARQHATIWADEDRRVAVARHMYAIRLGEVLPQRDMDALRGIEGQRIKRVYKQLADQYGIDWQGRRYDKTNPDQNDVINDAINHAATAMYASARIAVATIGAIPELGFIHESSGRAFALDIADLFRTSVTLPTAFEAAKKHKRSNSDIESLTRRLIGNKIRSEDVIPDMIDQIQKVLDDDDNRSHA
jgi:CRISPR-associated protein Cas1